jgi:predicted PurR-regulated permease PerM
LDSVFLLTLLTAVMALVPFLGAASVWIPACLWLYFYDERTWAASLLAIYGAAIVSMADNVIKPLVLHGQSRLHPLLALLSVLGGVQALGPIGILVGPMVVAFLQTLLNMLHRELITMDREPALRTAR